MGDRTLKLYSTAFKQKVISEIESGKHSLAEAKHIYDITGGDTIQRWLKKYGKNHLLPNVIRVKMKDEKDKIRELERQKQKLESALAQAQLKIMSLEALIDGAKEEYDIDIKKNYGATGLKRFSRRRKKKR